jgi:2-methylcitrate dehydratase PrpD
MTDLSWSVQHLLDHVAGLKYEELPSPVKDAARRVLFDTLGVIVGARAQPIAEKLSGYLALSSEPGMSTAICSFRKVSAATAAFANGSISHDLELDDIHQGTSLHVAAILVPAAIAIGEETNASAEDLFLALTRGYEISCRLAMTLDHEKLFSAGFHPTTVCGTIGASAVAASLLKLPAAQFRQAVYLAMSLSCGIMACKSEPDHYAKSFQCGVAARNGVMAAQWVMNGLELDGDPSTIFLEAARAYTGATPAPDPLTADLGQRRQITLTSYKVYPCCRCIHPLLDALSEIRRKVSIEPANVERMELSLYQRGAISVDDHTLRTHNARYVMAMALQRGVLTRELFTEDFGIDEIQPLMDRIELYADKELQKEWPEKYPGIVTIHTQDGKTYAERVDYPRGTPENPVSLGELKDKFFMVTTPVIGQERGAELADLLLEHDFTVREVMSVLTGSERDRR